MTESAKQFKSQLLPILLLVILMVIPACLVGCGGGRTTEGISISGIVADNNGNPLAGAKVSADMLQKTSPPELPENKTARNTSISTITDINGWFILANLAPGTYLITVEMNGYIAYTVEVTVGTGGPGNTVTLNIPLNPTPPTPDETGTVSGTVTFQSSIPVPDAAVPIENVVIKLTSGATVLTSTTDENGNYTFPNIPIGTYEVSAQIIGFSYTAEQISIPEGITQHNITMTPFVNFSLAWGGNGLEDGKFKGPGGIATDAEGNVYVVDYNSHNVQKFDSNGTFITKWGRVDGSGNPISGNGDGEFNRPHGIAIDTEGIVYVADHNNHRIQKFNPNGSFIGKWGLEGTGEGRLYCPGAVAVDTEGNVYVADSGNSRIQKFDSEGGFIAKWGSNGTGDGEFDWPYGVAVDSKGNVFVADSGNDRIQKFSSEGNYLGTWGQTGEGEGDLWYPGTVAVDTEGNVYVSDNWNYRIQKFTSNGIFITKWGSEGSEDGEFGSPWGIAIDIAGNVYVADGFNNYRIQKFTQTP